MTERQLTETTQKIQAGDITVPEHGLEAALAMLMSGPPPKWMEQFNVDHWIAFKNLATADEIAEFLKSQGVKGERAAVNSCPIATWTNSFAPGGDSFEVDKEFVVVHCGNKDYGSDMTPAMKEFIARFDNGEYPELER